MDSRMESEVYTYDNDVVIIVPDSNDSDLGADIEIRDDEDLTSHVEVFHNRSNRNISQMSLFDYYDYDSDYEIDHLHDERVQFLAQEQIDLRWERRMEEEEADSEDSDSSTQLYEVPNNDTVNRGQNAVQSGVEHVEEKSPVKNVDSKTAEVLSSSMDEDGLMCTICFEPWTCSGEHRLVSLRCGHLFGRKCIAKWVKNRDSKCPQCNARARKSEIRPIYARTVKMLDTSERDWAIKELELESKARNKAEMEIGRRKLECDMLRRELEGFKKENMTLQSQMKEIRAGGKHLPKLASQVPNQTFTCVQQINLKSTGCRVIDCSSILGMIAISQPSSSPLFSGYGLRKISMPNLEFCEFAHVHQKPIKDISFRHTDGCILTASLDKTVKLFNFLSNTVVQSYTLDCDVWSCCWDQDDPNYFYAGVSSGGVYIFDVRKTDGYLSQLPSTEERSPVVSLQYLKSQPLAKHNKCGPVVGQLGSCYFYERIVTRQSYSPHPLPLEGKFTSLSVESTTSHLLASCRPSGKHSQVTHTLCELSCNSNQFSCNFVHKMRGGSTQAQLTRSKLMIHPDNDNTVLVCAGDEESKSTLVWNGCTGSLINKLPANSPILDVATFRWEKPVLITLSDKTAYCYKWTGF